MSDDEIDRSDWSLGQYMRESHNILTRAKQEIRDNGKELVATYGLFSGGNDSTALVWLFRHRLDALVHVNTGIGIKQTTEFARAQAVELGLPFIEKHPPKPYRELVLKHGFPGPSYHWLMYRMLKERALREVRREQVTNGRRQRIMYVTGVRVSESKRRATNVLEWERRGSEMWVNPIAHWTKKQLNELRDTKPIPRNEVADLIHMSGECLCGAFAKPNEREEIRVWFPEVIDEIEELEREVASAGQLRCVWGNGGKVGEAPSKVGPMCSSCDVHGGRAG